MNPPNQSCATCKYQQKVVGDLKRLICRRYPPTPLIIASPQGLGIQAHFPEMQPTGWCGEFALRLALTS